MAQPAPESSLLTEFHGIEGHALRVVEIDGEPWFMAKDVCDALGTRTNDARTLVEDDEIKCLPNSHLRGRAPLIVSESGLYRLMMRSDKPQAPSLPTLGHPGSPAGHPTSRRLHDRGRGRGGARGAQLPATYGV